MTILNEGLPIIDKASEEELLTELISDIANRFYQESPTDSGPNAPDKLSLKEMNTHAAIPLDNLTSAPHVNTPLNNKEPEKKNHQEGYLPTTEKDIQSIIDRFSSPFGDSYLPYPKSDRKQKGTEKKTPLPEWHEELRFSLQSIRRDFPILQEKIHEKPLIWLDNAATTQKPEMVIDAVKDYYSHSNSNVHRGAHTLAKKATDVYETARQKVAQFIGASSSDEIIFVRGATEAINLVANTYGKKYINSGDEILITLIEHHSNILPWQMLCREKNAKLCVVPIDENGNVILSEYQKMLSNRTKLVAITQVSNALGTVVPVAEMTKMAHQYNAVVLVDGCQSIPHFEIDVNNIDCDFFVFSGHKLFAPTGIGVLYGKLNLLEGLPVWQEGGGMIEEVYFDHVKYAPLPGRFEAGTGNIAGAAGLGAAIDYINKIGIKNIATYDQHLTQYTIHKLSMVPKVKLIGNPTERVSVVPFVIDGIETSKVGSYFDKYGIALRVGHHCAQPALRFFNVKETIRPSVAFYNTQDEINCLAEVIELIAGRKFF